MGVAGGPHIKRDGLVFGYDTNYGTMGTDVSYRFYKGKPTTNDFIFSLFPSGYGGYGTIQTGALDPFGTTTNTVYRKTGKLRFGVTNGTDVGTLYYGSNYNFSIYLRHVSGETQTTSAEFDINDRTNTVNYTGNIGSNMTSEWKRFWVTAFHNNNSNYHFIDLGVYQGTNTFEWCCPQIELVDNSSAKPTPFIPYGTSRSSTQSLIDLTKTTDIDISNVSFDSTGQPTFDGTDDRINTTQLNGRNPSTHPFTVEAIVKAASTGGAKMWVDATSNGSNQRFYSALIDGVANHTGIQSSAWSDSNPGTTDYLHQTIVMNGSNALMYRNGSLMNTKAYSSYTMQSLVIGGRNGYYWNGEIPVFKIYDRALSVDEVKQNFNAYKNRFNL